MTNNFLKNIMHGLYHQMKFIFSNKFSKIGLSSLQVKKTKHLPKKNVRELRLLNNKLFYLNGFELIGGLDEIFIKEIYKQKLPENANIIDCGAHIGLSTIYLKMICPTAKIIAFEPDVLNYEILLMNINSFNLDKIDCRNEAIWNDETFISFIGGKDMSSRIVENNFENENLLRVKTTRLKNIINSKVDFLKIDIEGAEYLVLKDIEERLIYVQNLFLEYHGSFENNDQLSEIINILTRNKFNFYISEAINVFQSPFERKNIKQPYDLQLNIFCFRK